jgi:hypothetical protein
LSQIVDRAAPQPCSDDGRAQGLVDADVEVSADPVRVDVEHHGAAALSCADDPFGHQVVVGAGDGDQAHLQVAGEFALGGKRLTGSQGAAVDGAADLILDLLVHRGSRCGGQDDVHILNILHIYSWVNAAAPESGPLRDAPARSQPRHG